MQKKDANEKKVNNNIKEDKNNYSFVSEILKKNIGLIIDDFLKTNMGQQINKYNANTFALWCADGINNSVIAIENEINKLINKEIKK